MTMRPIAALALCLALAGCGDSGPGDGYRWTSRYSVNVYIETATGCTLAVAENGDAERKCPDDAQRTRQP